MRNPLNILTGTSAIDQLVTIKVAETSEMIRVEMLRNDGEILLNNPSKINSRIPKERINSGIKELIPFVISSNDTDNSVTISTDLRLSFFLH